jgi:hypothetical protein
MAVFANLINASLIVRMQQSLDQCQAGDPIGPIQRVYPKSMIMAENLRLLSKLRELLVEMEIELGLVNLSPGERDLLYAFVSESTGAGSVVTTNEVRRNRILMDMSDPTIYRHIVTLIEKGILALAPGRRRGAYVVDCDLSKLRDSQPGS